MEPSVNTNSKKILPKFTMPSQKIITVVLIIILLIAGITGGYFLLRNNFGNSGSYSFKYKDLNSVALPGSIQGGGISLQKPVELTTVGSTTPKQAQAYFTHTITKNSKSEVKMAQIFIATLNSGSNLQDTYKQNINTALIDSKNVSHESVVKPLKDYVTQRLKTSLTVTFSEAKALSTDNIKANAWYLTFSATPKDAKDKTTQPDLNGEVIFGMGKTTFYYVMVYSLSNNWQSNQEVWNQVINSIKLDQ